jgi:hypothetical protein
MGLLVDRQFKQCGVCGGKIQIDTAAYPGATEDAEPILEKVESHIGSCTPRPPETVVAEAPHPGYEPAPKAHEAARVHESPRGHRS